MARLEEITTGSLVKGILGNIPVCIVQTAWIGSNILDITYRYSQNHLGSQLLYRDDEPNLALAEASLPWSFDADGSMLRLASEAYRIRLAHLFDPYLAIHTSVIEPLPHQISAVYKEMLPRLPLRYILADDPGAGKTIMTGLLLKELIYRGDLKRCLIVSPGSLSEQWQTELTEKFSIHFDILTNDMIETSASGNPFQEKPMIIARLDKLSRNPELQEKLKVVDWDLIVCDEAHKMSASLALDGEVHYTKRWQLGKTLSQCSRNFLLLTASPHNGKEADFQLFMSLIDQDRFESIAKTGTKAVDVSDIMRRLVKEDLLKFDGKRLFPERRAETVNYTLSIKESRLYKAVTDYVKVEFNRADDLDGGHRATVGFALTVLQRRLASSPEAIYQSLHRRRERLERRLNEERIGRRAAQYAVLDEDFDDDDLSGVEQEQFEEEVAVEASASTTISELEAEISTLKGLERMADDVRASGEDRKWDELSKLLQGDRGEMFTMGGLREKLIIFTEHRDTLRYLEGKIRALLGADNAVVTIHGGLLRDERRKVEERFKQDKDVLILVATDAAGEGINLQRAHLMVNYDLPWNPNKLEQRFGRIHRIGQKNVCFLWNLVANETMEGQVFLRLFQKLEQEREALGGKVFDILGKVTFDNKSLRELLVEAIRYGSDPARRDYMEQVMERSFDPEELKRLLQDQALTPNNMNVSQVMDIRAEMERMEARKLQPHYISSFFMAAFERLGGNMREIETGRFEIRRVPQRVRNRNVFSSSNKPILEKYERICFDRSLCSVSDKPDAEQICPCHPLLEAVIDLTMEQAADTFKRGSVFIDDNDESTQVRLLFYIKDSIQDAYVLEHGGKRVISRALHFVEIAQDGSACDAGYAPYLDYRPAAPDELSYIRSYMDTQEWLKSNVESIARRYAVEEIIPPHLQEVRSLRLERIAKTEKAVKERLSAAINHWDKRAIELREREEAGKNISKLNAQTARQRADDLEARMEKRLCELQTERNISPAPPEIVSGALVIPLGLLARLMPDSIDVPPDADARREVERAAMNAVMKIERSLGYEPIDVSEKKVGYDILSIKPDAVLTGENIQRFIEVKGRIASADTVTVSRNEMLCAKNKPDAFILAMVEVDGERTHTTYLADMFNIEPGFEVVSVNFNIAKLKENSRLIYEE